MSKKETTGNLSVCHGAPVIVTEKREGTDVRYTTTCEKCGNECDEFAGTKQELAAHRKELK